MSKAPSSWTLWQTSPKRLSAPEEHRTGSRVPIWSSRVLFGPFRPKDTNPVPDHQGSQRPDRTHKGACIGLSEPSWVSDGLCFQDPASAWALEPAPLDRLMKA